MANEALQEDITLASTTETQAELDHATSPNWRDHFTPPAEPKEGEQKTEKQPGEAPKPGATEKTEPASDAGGKKPGAKGESGTEGEDDDTPLPKGVQKRLDRLTARLKAAEEELATSKGSRQQQPPPKTGAQADPEPQQKDFKSWEEWHEAHTRWAVRDEGRKGAEKSAADDAQARAKETYDSHLERIEQARTTHDDFDEVVRAAPMFTFASPQGNVAFQMAIIEAENGPEVLYHLAKNPEEMAKFADLSPVRIQLAIGKLSAALSPSSDKSGSVSKAVSKAPAPTSRVQRPTTATGRNIYDPDTAKGMSDDEWLRQREQDVRNSRKQRRN